MSSEDLSRPAEAVAITSDGLLHKVVLREGTGEVPPKHARCLVHYVGRIQSTGEVFMDTRQESESQEPEQIVAGRDMVYREVGLNLAVAGMKTGELCRVWAAPKYGYGEKGSFSFPTVPPNADLVYDVELLEFDPPDEGKSTGVMTFEERMEAAERRRQDGNALFQAGQYGEALSKYRLSLSYINDDLLMQLGDFHFQKAMDVKRPVLLNMAAAYLRERDYNATILTCTEVIKEDPQNAKALFRRGKARAALGQSEGALQDMEKARGLAPEDAGIARELAAVRRMVKQDRQASGQVFKGYFDKAAGKGAQLYEEPPPAAAAGSDEQQQQQQQTGHDGTLARLGGVMAALHALWAWLLAVLSRLLPFLARSPAPSPAALHPQQQLKQQQQQQQQLNKED